MTTHHNFDLNELKANHSAFAHHRRLTREISDLLIIAARRGWTPHDLRSVAGSGIDPLLVDAQLHVHGSATYAVRTAWQRQCRSCHNLPPAGHDLEMIKLRLENLPRLRDADIVTDVDYLDVLCDAAREDTHGTTAPHARSEEKRIRQRINHLLRKAESTTYEAEAASLVAKAQQLRQRYRLDRVANEPRTWENSQLVSVRVHLTGTWVRYQFLLLSHVARPNSCESILVSSVNIASVIGHPEDVRHVIELFDGLNRQRDYFMRTSPGAQEAALARQTASYRRSFLVAFAHRIGALLTIANDDVPAQRAGDGTALELLKDRGAAASEFMGSVFNSASNMSFSPTHRQGFVDGINAATNSHRSTTTPVIADRAG